MITKTDVDRLRAEIAGEVIAPGDVAYDEARRVWNARFDKRPAVIAQPASAEDVARAIRFGRDRDLEIAVRSGGHSASGHSSVDGGLVIDLARMRGVTVDPERRMAHANGGAFLGELDVAAQAHGLVCPVGVVGHTGVAGLTLGAGVGRLQRNFGLTIDSLRAVELVTADGLLVRASATEQSDLFWGMRGAGPNFGIVTAFDFDLHEFGPMLYRGLRIYPQTQVHDVWSIVRDFARNAPDQVALIMTIARAEPAEDYPAEVAGKVVVFVSYNHSGDAPAAERDLAPFNDNPKPAVRTDTSVPYLEVQTAHDLVMGPGHRTIIESAYVDDLGSATLDALVEHAAAAPSGASVSVTLQGGAIARVADDAMAFTGRTAAFDISADTTWEDEADDRTNVDWIDRAMELARPDFATGRYLNGLSATGEARTREIYGDAKLDRLRDLKRAWDPGNVFHLNHNIAP